MFGKNIAALTDEELMSRIQSGDEGAMTELYGRYSKQMVRYFYRMLWQDQNKAQDFLHDLFVRLIERPELFDVSRKFSTWIYSVAHNMCKNEYRKVSFRNNAQSFVQFETSVNEKITEEMDQKYLQQAIARAMESWEEDDRSLFVFRQELEMTFVEIGGVLGIPEGTAKSRWFYLRKQLADSFRDYKILLKAI